MKSIPAESLNSKYNRALSTYAPLLAALTSLLIIALLLVGNWFTDDAFISFRYADNLLKGNGLVFNSGEYVQGYTNFLWVILLAAGGVIGLDYQIASTALNIISFYLLSVYLYRLLLDNYPKISRTSSLLITLFAVSAPPLLCWTVGGGLEGPFFAFLVFASFFYIVNNGRTRPAAASVFAAAAFLTRPEGLLFFGIGLLIILFKDRVKRRTEILYFVTIFMTVLIAYLIWNYFYYGGLLPNTFHAKVAFGAGQFLNGIKYAFEFFMTAPYLLLFIPLAVLLYNSLSSIARYATAVILLYTFYVILIGGDFMFAYRFMIPALPFFGLITADIIGQILPADANVTSPARLIPLLLFLTAFNFFSAHYFYKYRYAIENYPMIGNGRSTAEYFNDTYKEEITIASSGIGALGYYSRHRILDVLGLTDKKVAASVSRNTDHIFSHSRSNADYVLGKEPGVIIFGMPPGDQIPVRIAEIDIYNHERFKGEYTFVEIPWKDSLVIKYYKRK